MSDTVDDLGPLGTKGRRAIAVAKTAAVVVGILASAIIGAITTYRAATADAQARVRATKDRAEAGYQVTRQVMEELQQRVLVLEQAAKRTQVEAGHAEARARTRRRGAPTLPPAVPVKVNPTRPLPGDLDKAERQVYRAGPPAAPVNGDGGAVAPERGR